VKKTYGNQKPGPPLESRIAIIRAQGAEIFAVLCNGKIFGRFA
jgi:hypothetical protein